MTDEPINLAVLVSGSGSTLQNLIEQIESKKLNARIALVVGSKHELAAAQRAARASVPYHVIARNEFKDCAMFSSRVFDTIDEAGVDLVCMGGWLCLTEIPWRYEYRVMNIHPALLPSFGGKDMYGPRVHRAVLDHGCKVSGCTVHFVDNTYDNGPIILQRCCEVRDDDTPETLAARVFEQEKIAYPEAIRLFASGRLSVNGRVVRIRQY